MNHFRARLIFCLFAEDTDIFGPNGQFTGTIEQMSAKDSSNTHEVIGTLIRAMNVKSQDRSVEGVPIWARPFPYVNGGLFSGSMVVPRFSRIARSYLLHVGHLEEARVGRSLRGVGVACRRHRSARATRWTRSSGARERGRLRRLLRQLDHRRVAGRSLRGVAGTRDVERQRRNACHRGACATETGGFRVGRQSDSARVRECARPVERPAPLFSARTRARSSRS